MPGNIITRHPQIRTPSLFDPAQVIRKYGTDAFYMPDANPERPTRESGLPRLYGTRDGKAPAEASDPIITLFNDALGARRSANLWDDNGTIVGEVTRIGPNEYNILDTDGSFDGVYVHTGGADQLEFDIEVTRKGSGVGVKVSDGAGGAAFNLSPDVEGRYALRFVHEDTTKRFYLQRINDGTDHDILVHGAYTLAGAGARQHTPSLAPTLINTAGPRGDRWALNGDGTEYLETSLLPGTVMTAIVAGQWEAANDIMLGSRNAGTKRFQILTDNSGRLAAQVGSQYQSTIYGGSDIRGVPGVAALRSDGTTVDLWWLPMDLSSPVSSVYSDAQVGDTDNGYPLYLLGGNIEDTSVEVPADGDMLALASQKSAWTDNEIIQTMYHFAQHAGVRYYG